MKTEYVWNYKIKVKDKNGEYVYEDETLENLQDIILQHPHYEEIKAEHIKSKVLRKAFIKTYEDERNDRRKE